MAEQQIPSALLAKALGLEQSTFSRRLRGHVDWSVNELAAIAGLLGVGLIDLLPNTQNAGDQVAAGALYAMGDSNPQPADLPSRGGLRLVVGSTGSTSHRRTRHARLLHSVKSAS